MDVWENYHFLTIIPLVHLGGNLIYMKGTIVRVMLKNIENFIDKRLDSYGRNIYSIYAATLKNERVRLQMTLGDITRGLCSKSYVSKIENNLLVPDEHIMKILFERVNLNYDKIVASDQTNNLPLCMCSYLFNQYDQIEEVYSNLNNEYFFVRDALIKALYYLLKARYDDFVIEIKNIDEIKNTLNDYELTMLMLCTTEYYLKTNQFKDAKEYVGMLERIAIEDDVLQMLYLQQKFIIACNLCDQISTYEAYNNLQTKNGYPLKNKFLIKLLYLEAFPNEDAIIDLKNMEIDYIPEEFYEEYYYSKYIVYIKLGHVIDVIEEIIAKNFTNVRFVALFGYCLLCLQNSGRHYDKNYIQAFDDLHQQMEYNKFDAIHLNFVKLMIYEIKGGAKDEVFQYLKNTLILNMENKQHRFYSVYYAIKYVRTLGNRSRYKEAYQFTLSHPHLLKDYHNSIYC